MDRDLNKVVDTTPATETDSLNLAQQNSARDRDFLDYEDEDELDRFEVKLTKTKIQFKRRRAAGA